MTENEVKQELTDRGSLDGEHRCFVKICSLIITRLLWPLGLETIHIDSFNKSGNGHRETLGGGENEKLSILALLWHFLTFLSQSSSWQMCWFCVIKVIKTKKMISLIFKEDQENQHVNISEVGSSKFCHFCFKKLNYLNSYPLIFCHLTHQLSDWLFQL